MNTDLLIMRIKSLCNAKGVNMTTAFTQSGVGKNFKSNLPSVSKKNLTLLADYFGVSVPYLLGEESEAEYERKVVGLVLEWLADNDYDYLEEDNDTVSIGKDGDYIYLNKSDFVTECLAIKKTSEEGFELAMLDWERRTFNTTADVSSHHHVIKDSSNVINDSPHATLTVNDANLSKQEEELIKMYRKFSLAEQMKLITYALNIEKGEGK